MSTCQLAPHKRCLTKNLAITILIPWVKGVDYIHAVNLRSILKSKCRSWKKQIWDYYYLRKLFIYVLYLWYNLNWVYDFLCSFGSKLKPKCYSTPHKIIKYGVLVHSSLQHANIRQSTHIPTKTPQTRYHPRMGYYAFSSLYFWK